MTQQPSRPSLPDFDFPVHPVEGMAPGTFILMAPDTMRALLDPGEIRWREDPWPEAPYGLSSTSRDQRRRALDHLEGLLDDWCKTTTLHGVPLDPDRVWRNPKIAESRAKTDRLRYVADQTIALHIRRPEDSVKIVVTP